MKEDERKAHNNLKIWTENTRSKKESKVGSDKIDERGLDRKELIKRLKISGLI